MAPEDGATSISRNIGHGGTCGRTNNGQVLKKGPWTAAEDAILMEYVRKHGEGNWNAVQRNSGLMRCGKSCRLRWANHLRPNLKKGAFTPDEERQIIELHSKFGNKWARMALHQHYRRNHDQSLQNQTIPFSSSSSSSNHALNSISSPLLLNQLNYPVLSTPAYLPNSQSQFKLFRDNGGVVVANSSPSSMLFFNQSYHGASQIPKMEASFNELPSIQSSFQAITPTCSSNTVNDQMIVPSNDGDNAISPYICPRGNSGLLEDVLGESRALLSSQILSNESKSSESDKGKEKVTHDYSLMEEPENVTLESVFKPNDNNMPLDDSSSGHSSDEIGEKSRSDVIDEMNVTDDDFSSWLDFPTGWYGGNEQDASTEKKPVDAPNGNIVGAENQVEILCSPDATTTETDHDHDWTMGSYCWNNMPGFS
ncbi:homeodomain-like protein [Artemisia annua]|uniref:Homeodomain-like protein n=1 Tax=Artemisia annua TaxID=35608 RepID=A0A2U1Q774_ARTAN|nr:homeodomain-like protein [Artemisia annua]